MGKLTLLNVVILSFKIGKKYKFSLSINQIKRKKLNINNILIVLFVWILVPYPFRYYNPSQNIWHKVKKHSKIGQDFKNVISDFAYFLTALVNV